MIASLAGPLIGGATALGAVLVLAVLVLRPGRLAGRVMPHVATGAIRPRKATAADRVKAKALELLEPLGTPRAVVAKRLDMLGDEDLPAFRLRQLQWAAIGGAGGLVVGLFGIASGSNAVLALFVVALGAALGAYLVDYQLGKRVEERSAAYTRELPDVVELLALAVGSGESIRESLERVARIGNGAVVGEVRRMLSFVHAGRPMAQAITEMGVRSDNPELARFCDAVVSAIERGTGLADTLHTQATDTRQAARRTLLELGGKAEISMMVPVVFLILPITVLFTLFPGLRALSLG